MFTRMLWDLNYRTLVFTGGLMNMNREFAMRHFDFIGQQDYSIKNIGLNGNTMFFHDSRFDGNGWSWGSIPSSLLLVVNQPATVGILTNHHGGMYKLVGGIPTPLKNMKVSWDDDIPNVWKHNPFMFQTTNQITIIFPLLLVYTVYTLFTTMNHHY